MKKSRFKINKQLLKIAKDIAKKSKSDYTVDNVIGTYIELKNKSKRLFN